MRAGAADGVHGSEGAGAGSAASAAARSAPSLRVAMVGQRGVPATWGGIERHVEELGARLVERGHEVTVYCRSNYQVDARRSHRGMRLRLLPTVGTKHLDAIAHSAVSTLAALPAGYDVVHYHALGPGLVAPLPRYASRAKVVLTVHGLDNERAKWGRGARLVLDTAAWMSAHVPDATITVSADLARHYSERYGRHATYIANGVDAPAPRPPALIRRRFGLQGGDYVLFVGRLVPEKAPDVLLRAFRAVPGDTRLVLVGGSSFTAGFVADLHRSAAADPRVLLADYVYGEALAELYTNAATFVLPSRLEGLPLTLLEAASYGTPIVASDIPPHVEVLGSHGPGHRLVPPGDEEALAGAITTSLAGPDIEQAGGAEVRRRVLARYRWDDAAAATESVYASVTTGVTRRVPAR